ncbi:hypothetical protein EVAR_22781_1 [Eumeta japonica]|uniref:Mos1 transposase HTH domain-containing protein n=1 Tax=Eumeta variegata TaxID=151549 RepID=A0A4C1USI6_EUMVA|nr:hypothetical protein EVAR_22781_1 [Eumeta japonica]
MDLSRENFRSMIFYDFKCNLTVQKSLARLRTVFGDGAPFKTTIYNWFAEFKRVMSISVTNFVMVAVHRCEQKDRCCAAYDQNKQACDLPLDSGILRSRHETNTINSKQTLEYEKAVIEVDPI